MDWKNFVFNLNQWGDWLVRTCLVLGAVYVLQFCIVNFGGGEVSFDPDVVASAKRK
jgi:hypothetical protein